MKTHGSVHIVALAILTLFSCKESTTNPYDQPTSVNFLSSKCETRTFTKATTPDSIFTYTFRDELLVDFSVWANCCPDSNRFAVSYRMAVDTIIISVADTAEQLCRCMCLYMVHAGFTGLQRDHYVVRCRLGHDQGYTDPIHLVHVYRERSAAQKASASQRGMELVK